jgi:hypothetical protein
MTYEREDKFPVYVTYTTRHLVWVDAANQAEAVDALQSEPYEYTNSSNVIDGYSDVEAPTKYDNPHERQDAHVQTWKEHLRRLYRDHGEAMAEEENRRGTRPVNRTTCVFCRMWLDDKFHSEYQHKFAVRDDERRAAKMAEALAVTAS